VSFILSLRCAARLSGRFHPRNDQDNSRACVLRVNGRNAESLLCEKLSHWRAVLVDSVIIPP